MQQPLLQVMEHDSHPYARYRAAFALAEHGVGSYKKEVLRVLEEAAEDKEVSKIAGKYLRKLK